MPSTTSNAKKQTIHKGKATMTVQIYHNPRCSKSRQALALLEKNGVTPEIVLYLETPPTPSELRSLLKKLDLPAAKLLRTGEKLYKQLELGDSNLAEDALLTVMNAHPELIERPIVIKGDKAKIGRPPEAVLEII